MRLSKNRVTACRWVLFDKIGSALRRGFAGFSAENPAGYGVFDHNHTDYGQKPSCRGRSPLRPVSYGEYKSDFFDTLSGSHSAFADGCPIFTILPLLTDYARDTRYTVRNNCRPQGRQFVFIRQ